MCRTLQCNGSLISAAAFLNCLNLQYCSYTIQQDDFITFHITPVFLEGGEREKSTCANADPTPSSTDGFSICTSKAPPHNL
jgi:hypothetical protein